MTNSSALYVFFRAVDCFFVKRLLYVDESITDMDRFFTKSNTTFCTEKSTIQFGLAYLDFVYEFHSLNEKKITLCLFSVLLIRKLS